MTSASSWKGGGRPPWPAPPAARRAPRRSTMPHRKCRDDVVSLPLPPRDGSLGRHSDLRYDERKWEQHTTRRGGPKKQRRSSEAQASGDGSGAIGTEHEALPDPDGAALKGRDLRFAKLVGDAISDGRAREWWLVDHDGVRHSARVERDGRVAVARRAPRARTAREVDGAQGRPRPRCGRTSRRAVRSGRAAHAED